jgi:hypothetical protein
MRCATDASRGNFGANIQLEGESQISHALPQNWQSNSTAGNMAKQATPMHDVPWKWGNTAIG